MLVYAGHITPIMLYSMLTTELLVDSEAWLASQPTMSHSFRAKAGGGVGGLVSPRS